MFTVAIDTREKAPLDFTFCGYESKICTLKTGDYTLVELLELEKRTGEKILRIERKASSSELAANLGRKRETFYDELKRLQEFKYKYLILEFTIATLMVFPKFSGIPKSSWYKLNRHGKLVLNVKMSGKYMFSLLDKIKQDFGIEIIFAGSRNRTITIMEEIFTKVYNEYKEKI